MDAESSSCDGTLGIAGGRISKAASLAEASGLWEALIERVPAGKARLAASAEFMQRTDPLFLPPGQIRVPEGDMTKRNPTLQALAAAPVIDAVQGTEARL